MREEREGHVVVFLRPYLVPRSSSLVPRSSYLIPQYAPRPESTVGIVRSRMRKSSPNDQFSM